MSIRCAFGFHSWEVVMEKREKPTMEWFSILVVPSLFVGPPYMAPLFQYPSTHKCVGWRCGRCGQSKSA